MRLIVDVAGEPPDAGALRDSLTLTLRDLSQPGWRLDPLRPEVGTFVAEGRRSSVADIEAVEVRTAVADPRRLEWVDPGDREYAAAEMAATLRCWLAGLPAPVERRPRPPSPLGRHDEPRPGWPVLMGSSVDDCMAAVRSCLYRRGTAPVVMDESAWSHCSISGVNGSMAIEHSNGSFPLASVGGIYLRPGLAPGPMELALLVWAERARGAVLNRPSAMSLNDSKPFQLREIARSGFAVPPTLVTTSPHTARRFAKRHGRVVFKSVSGVRSIATELGPGDAARLGEVAACPTLFQAFVPGVDVRAHIVGSRVFACEIASDGLDYRYAGLVSMWPADIDRRLARQLVAMVRGMGLWMAGVDLRRTPEGRWVCFEVNPSPAFTYYTDQTDQPVAEAIADLLASPEDT